MRPSPISVTRRSTLLKPDQSRVLLRPFDPGGAERIVRIIQRVLMLDESQVGPLLEKVCAEFSTRHHEVSARLRERFEQVQSLVPLNTQMSDSRKLLIGSYLMAEYSLESAALFNPSIVPDPNQAGLPPGAMRFILSLRATGEGHISSITFRSGIVYEDLRIEVEPTSGFLREPRQIPNPVYEKALFERTLLELGVSSHCAGRVLFALDDRFSLEELRNVLIGDEALRPEGLSEEERRAAQGIWMLARSNYDVQFASEQDISQRILFPATPSQRNGIEDARFVSFHGGDGEPGLFYATFTAFDGRMVMPELVETSDFLRFRFCTLNGPAAQNKGMALFPRKINGRYAMLSRQDNENISLMFSENVHFWNESGVLLEPAFPWELVQMGNCGSPIETEAGWLVLSHGVGPMRKYCIGAFLLDLDDPSRVIGRSREPLIEPNAEEREGYVPNVVYTCGALVHNGTLIIPYGLADHAAGFATIPVSEVLAAMERTGA